MKRSNYAKKIISDLKESLDHLEFQVQNRVIALRYGICTPEELIKHTYAAYHEQNVRNCELGFDSNNNDF